MSKDVVLKPFKELLGWAQEHGAYLHEKGEIYVDARYGASLRVKKATTAHSGSRETVTIDLTADEPENHGSGLPPSSRIVSCPYDISLSYFNAIDASSTLARRSPAFPGPFLSLDPKIVTCFFLVQQWLMKEESFWAPYVRALPQPDEPHKLATPLYYSEEERHWFRGTNMEGAIAAREDLWRQEFLSGRHTLDSAKGLEAFRGQWTWELYKWAATILSSRSFVSKLVPGTAFDDGWDRPSGVYVTLRERIAQEGPFPVLFPLVDIANHDSKARVEWRVNENGPVRDLNIVTDDAILPGKQIFNNYAPKGNTELLLGYGFVIPGNDDMAIAIKCPDQAHLELRRSQPCCSGEEGKDGKWIYTLTLKALLEARKRSKEPGTYPDPLTILPYLPHGLFCSLLCFLANDASFSILEGGGRADDWCPQDHFVEVLRDPVLRTSALAALSMLEMQLRRTLDKLTEISLEERRREPKTSFERTANQYAAGQVQIAHLARSGLTPFLEQHTWTIPQIFQELKCINRGVFDAALKALAHEDTLDVAVDLTNGATLLRPSHEVDWAEIITEGWDTLIWTYWVWLLLMLHFSDGWSARRDAAEHHIGEYADSWASTMLQNEYYTGLKQRYSFAGTDEELEIFENIEEQLFDELQRATGGPDAGPLELNLAARDWEKQYATVQTRSAAQEQHQIRRKLLNVASHIVAGETFVAQRQVAGQGEGEAEALMQRVLPIERVPENPAAGTREASRETRAAAYLDSQMTDEECTRRQIAQMQWTLQEAWDGLIRHAAQQGLL